MLARASIALVAAAAAMLLSCRPSAVPVAADPAAPTPAAVEPRAAIAPTDPMPRQVSGNCALHDGHAWCRALDPSLSVPAGPGGWRRAADIDHATSLACGREHCCALDDDQRVHCFGANDRGQVGSPNEPRAPARHTVELPAAQAIFAGPETSCATVNETLWCWGRSWTGPDATARAAPIPARVEGLPAVVDVAIATEHACAITRGGALWCWGRGLEGQLGRDHTVRHAAPAAVATDGRVVSLAAAGFATTHVQHSNRHT